MESNYEAELLNLESKRKNLTQSQLADEAVRIAMRQLMTSTEFKKPRLNKIERYWELYDGKTTKKLRQLFNVPIPVFSGMIDTLNAQYDTPVSIKFREGDPSDYFKVEKIDAAFQTEVMDTSENSKWEAKLRMVRKHAIMTGRGITRYTVESDPEYVSKLDVVNLKNFHFQPRGGVSLENHLFAGEEDIEKTETQLRMGALAGAYDKAQVSKLIAMGQNSEYLPDKSLDLASKLSRFRPLGLDPDNHSYVGESVYKLANWILNIDGTRYYLCFHPWTQTWIRFEKWSELNASELLPWDSYATHEDDENFLSKSYGDDLYVASDSIVAMFNQELTNREKRNFGARAYDKDMFPDVRKLDEAMHRPDALVPADTKGGTRLISQGVYEFRVGELNGTVNLIDWITGSLGRNTGATDLSMGSVQEVSKKASVTFAEQKSVSKRVSWASAGFQEMMGSLGKKYIYGLKEHMPSKMAVRLLGETGWDWAEITRLDLDTKKDVDIIITSTDKEAQESELRASRRREALALISNSPNINSRKRDEEMLRSIGQYSDQEIAEFLDTATYADKRSIAKAVEATQMVMQGKKPQMWYGATTAFMQKIVDFATDNRTTLKDKYDILMDYAMAHAPIARENMERKTMEARMQQTQSSGAPSLATTPSPTDRAKLPGGISHALNMAELAV